jgi:DNA-binding phage protein
VSNYRTIREVEEEYLHNHPEEIDDYITVLFDEYAEGGDTSSLLASLRIVGRVKGVSHIAEVSGLSRQGVQHQ